MQVQLDVGYDGKRNRLTSAFRIILAIPHLVLTGLWGRVCQFAAVAQWFVVLFTGKRNKALWDFQNAWLAYDVRVQAYTGLLYDTYPAFLTDPGTVPVRYELDWAEPADRLTSALRIIWAIPAMLLAVVLVVAYVAVVLAAWVVILVTGAHPRGMFDFQLKALRYFARTQAYVFLMTDDYPHLSESPVGAAA